MGESGRVGIPETVAPMSAVLPVICASALLAAATMRWGLLFASLAALVVVAWAAVLQKLLDE